MTAQIVAHVRHQLHTGLEVATGVSGAVDVKNMKEALAYINLSAVTALTTLDVDIQSSFDNSNWFSVSTHAFTQLVATGTEAIKISNFGRWIRANWVLVGTNVTFTVDVDVKA